MVVKIFYKDGCPLCPAAKELGKNLISKKVSCEFFDVETVEGLAEASFYGIQTVPSIIIEEGERILSEWKGRIPDEKDIGIILK